jgi:hypothetical protein
LTQPTLIASPVLTCLSNAQMTLVLFSMWMRGMLMYGRGDVASRHFHADERLAGGERSVCFERDVSIIADDGRLMLREFYRQSE